MENLEKPKERFEECRLELHPTKIKIVYCKDKDRVKEFPAAKIDFPGYTFKRIYIKDKIGRYQFSYLSFASKKQAKNFRDKIKAIELHKMIGGKIEMITE